MKVAIIGGGGLVGSCAAYALQCGGVVRELAILDLNQDLAGGHALDLLHGGPSTADQVITGGSYEHIPSSDIICITAGLRRKPDESRLDLINRNTDLFVSILNEVAKAGVKKDAVVLVVSNPVDILTYVAADRLNLPVNQVLGLGTQLERYGCSVDDGGDAHRFVHLLFAQVNRKIHLHEDYHQRYECNCQKVLLLRGLVDYPVYGCNRYCLPSVMSAKVSAWGRLSLSDN